MGATLATFGGRHFNTVLTIGCKHPVEPSQVYSWFGHQSSQFGHKIEWFKNDVRGFSGESRFSDQMGRDDPVHDLQYLAHQLRAAGEQESQQILLLIMSSAVGYGERTRRLEAEE